MESRGMRRAARTKKALSTLFALALVMGLWPAAPALAATGADPAAADPAGAADAVAVADEGGECDEVGEGEEAPSDALAGPSAEAPDAEPAEGASPMAARAGMRAMAAGSLSITSSNGVAPAYDETTFTWTLSSGEYTVSGTGADEESIVIAGDVTLTLAGATIAPTAYRGGTDAATVEYHMGKPGISVKSGSATLVLADGSENAVAGGYGCAGVYVAKDASLEVSGSGSLTATGGDYSAADVRDGRRIVVCAGAGIGGNGGKDNDRAGGNDLTFGTVTIGDGTIVAKGGKASFYGGAGAGIGTGGASDHNADYDSEEGEIFAGTVVIAGGNVTATGGDGIEGIHYGLGGAGIGTGAHTAEDWGEDSDDGLNIVITGGTVVATGSIDGAGIGGGGNVSSGIINISGGNVTATSGTYNPDGSNMEGAAGIGGGDNKWVNKITISGKDTVVAATGWQGGAGIGGGYNGDGGEISISEATVTANGGTNSYTHSTYGELNIGGAGIGSGSGTANGTWKYAGFQSIKIGDGATIRAFAGAGAQAIGLGSLNDNADPAGFAFKVTLDSSDLDIWACNRDNTQSAVYGFKFDGTLDEDHVDAGNADVVWYVNDTMPEAGSTDIDAYSNDSVFSYTWNLGDDGKTVTLKYADNGEQAVSRVNENGVGNWLITFVPERKVTHVVTFDSAGGSAVEDQEVEEGQAATRPADPTREGFTFKGWQLDGADYDFSAPVTGDITLKATWEAAPAPDPAPAPAPEPSDGGEAAPESESESGPESGSAPSDGGEAAPAGGEAAGPAAGSTATTTTTVTTVASTRTAGEPAQDAAPAPAAAPAGKPGIPKTGDLPAGVMLALAVLAAAAGGVLGVAGRRRRRGAEGAPAAGGR